MDWQELKGGFSMARVEAGVAADDAMTAFCERISTDVIPKNASVDWDHLRLEVWPDSGRMIAFPASTRTQSRIEKAGCQIVFGDLLNTYDSLADSELDDDDFESRLRAELQSWIDRFFAAASMSGLKGKRTLVWNSDDHQPICDRVI